MTHRQKKGEFLSLDHKSIKYFLLEIKINSYLVQVERKISLTAVAWLRCQFTAAAVFGVTSIAIGVEKALSGSLS